MKTRIAAKTSDEKALDIYRELLDNTLAITINIDADKYLYYSSFIDNNDSWSSDVFHKNIQSGSDIGQKMNHAIIEKSGFNEKIVLIGSDIGALTEKIINDAFQKLDDHDIVIGPAIDGGYYLIGMKKAINIFDQIDWSTDKVLKQTIEQIKQLNLNYILTTPLSDIDFIEDYNAWKDQ